MLDAGIVQVAELLSAGIKAARKRAATAPARAPAGHT
jgi:hypothetical protein